MLLATDMPVAYTQYMSMASRRGLQQKSQRNFTQDTLAIPLPELPIKTLNISDDMGSRNNVLYLL